MNETKGFVRIKIGEFMTVINYLNKGDYLIGITLNDTAKVTEIKQNTNFEVADGIKGTDFMAANIEVVVDNKLVHEVFDEMTAIKHNHFREYDDKLVAIKIMIK